MAPLVGRSSELCSVLLSGECRVHYLAGDTFLFSNPSKEEGTQRGSFLLQGTGIQNSRDQSLVEVNQDFKRGGRTFTPGRMDISQGYLLLFRVSPGIFPSCSCYFQSRTRG